MPRRPLWIGFIPFALVSIVHVAALAVDAEVWAAPSKLVLMPLLALAAFWGGYGSRWGTTYTLLFLAIALSWLGDGAGTFFPAAPTVPMMLLFFGLAHLCYIWLFWRILAVRRVPSWALVYALWYAVLLALLWPTLGALLIAVALYGLVLGGTAVAASRCHPLIVWAARSSSPPTPCSRSRSSCPMRRSGGRVRSSCSCTASARGSSRRA